MVNPHERVINLTRMNWKKQLTEYMNAHDWDGDKLPHFISTEIIEKLIADIPLELPNAERSIYNAQLRNQLRDKWL
jgi:hypothetical protein